MQGAVRVWQDNAIADGYGAMNPGAMVDRGGQLSFLNGKVPAFPNIQFWDYTKRIIDDQIGGALRAGENQKARTLTTLARNLRSELDQQVPAYASARQAWGGPSQYLASIEEGGNILQRSVNAEQLRADLADMTAAQREGYILGAVSKIVNQMRSDPAKLADYTKYLRSPEMRDKIAALMPTPEAADTWIRRLDYEVRSSELTNRGLGNSATYRRQAERQDADNLAADLMMGAVLHPAGFLQKNFIGRMAGRIRDTLRSRSDAILADTLVTPRSQSLQPTLQAAGAPRPSALPPSSAAAVYGDQALQRPRIDVGLPPYLRAKGGAVPPRHERKMGKIYNTPQGRARWYGKGWLKVDHA